MVNFLFLLLGLLLVGAAHAKVVFLDLNFAEGEVAAAKKEALARGEKFVAIPDFSHLSPVQKKKLLALKIERADKNISEARLKYIDAQFAPYTLTQEKLAAELKNNSQDVSSFIISGHSNGHYFTGVAGTLTRSELKEATDDAKVSSNVHSLYLWGCYSGTAGAVQAWKDVFPNNDYLIGFSTKADIAESPLSAKKLVASMKMEAKARQENEQNEILKALNKANMSDPLHSISALINECYYLTEKNSATPLDQVFMDCKNKMSLIEAKQEIFYTPYHYGLKPAPVDGTESPYRKFYDLVQNSAHCLIQCNGREDYDEYFKEVGLTAEEYGPYTLIPCPGAILFDIKFSHVVTNYKRAYQEEFEFYKKALEGNDKVTPECKKLMTGDFDENDRRLIQKTAGNGGECFTQVGSLSVEVNNTFTRLDSVLNQLEGIPPAWIDDQSNPGLPMPGFWNLNEKNILPVTKGKD